jgi:hypothetical protein
MIGRVKPQAYLVNHDLHNEISCSEQTVSIGRQGVGSAVPAGSMG